MDFQEIFSLLFGLATTCLGFFVRRLIQELDSQKQALETLRAARPTAVNLMNNLETGRIRDTYVKYEEFVRLQTSIDAKLSQIYELLAGGRH